MIDPVDSARRILIIDDQACIHDTFRQILSEAPPDTSRLDAFEEALFASAAKKSRFRAKFHLEHAHQGQEGLELVKNSVRQRKHFGLAFVDMLMPPGWSGMETIEHLWAVDPGLQIVVCSAYSDHTWQEICDRLGRVDQLLLLNKPFAPEYVLSLAYSLTEKRMLMDRLQAELSTAQQSNERLEQAMRSRQYAEDSLRRMATRDTLTGLPNRAALEDRLHNCIERVASGTPCFAALLFMDIDNFKIVNDSLGHQAGDSLLVQISQRLTTLLSSCNCSVSSVPHAIYRLGGDEFVILLECIDSIDEATRIADRVNALTQLPFDIDSRPVTISSSIGIALINDVVTSVSDALRNADTAMYRAKSGGKNRYAIFDVVMHKEVLAQLEMEHELRAAISQQDFELHYQPIVDIRNRRTVGFEALARWRKSNGESVSPENFIRTAEETGLIVPLGRWVLERACRDFSEWRDLHGVDGECSISVNVSKRQLLDDSFVDDVRYILSRFRLKPRDLRVEVTESTVMDCVDTIAHRLNDLKNLGVGIHMDDFGTGHSSLSCLHRFPLDMVKIDRSFIRTMDKDPDYVAIIRAIVVLAHQLRIAVTAEGIETVSQMQILDDLECNLGQGYLFARPAPADWILSKRCVLEGTSLGSPGSSAPVGFCLGI